MKAIITALALIGAVIVFGAVSTSDFFTMELVQTEPTYVWGMFKLGCALMMPKVIQIICSEVKGGKHNVLHR